jgi:4-hydroxybutyrate dehydrogenase/sulfolactaldehyde 3-reductase
MTEVGFVGIGVMGAPMARNLIKGGFGVRAYDIDTGALQAIAKDGAAPAASPRAAADGADFVITMLPQGRHVMQATFGADGIAAGLAKDALYIDMSTILPGDTDEVGRRLAELGLAMVDAPVGRTADHAVAGTLLIMAGGSQADVDRARPLFERMGDTVVHCGPRGMGSRMKIVNNYLSVALNVLTAEAVTLAEASGLDRDLAIEVLRGTAAGRGHLATTWPIQVLAGNCKPGFMIDLAHKDMGLALDMAASLRVPSALGAAARQIYAIAQVQGQGRDDWTCLLHTLRRLAGLPDETGDSEIGDLRP